MASQPNLFTVIRASNRQHWTDSFTWLAYTALGGLLPLWGGWLLLMIFKRRDQWPQLISHGELVIYSAAFLAPAVWVIQRDVASVTFVHRQVFNLMAFVGLAITWILFTGVTIVSGAPTLSPSPPTFLTLDQDAMLWISVPLFFMSLGLAFLVTLVDHLRTNPDVRQLTDQARRKLEDDFTKTGEGI